MKPEDIIDDFKAKMLSIGFSAKESITISDDGEIIEVKFELRNNIE